MIATREIGSVVMLSSHNWVETRPALEIGV
jgi:hypothetical protein